MLFTFKKPFIRQPSWETFPPEERFGRNFTSAVRIATQHRPDLYFLEDGLPGRPRPRTVDHVLESKDAYVESLFGILFDVFWTGYGKDRRHYDHEKKQVRLKFMGQKADMTVYLDLPAVDAHVALGIVKYREMVISKLTKRVSGKKNAYWTTSDLSGFVLGKQWLEEDVLALKG